MSHSSAPRPRPLRVEMLEQRLPLAGYLKMPGIGGSASAKGHEKEIEVFSWSWGETSSSSAPSVSEIVITKVTDKASPKLLLASAQGTPIPKVVLDLKVAGGSQQTYLRYELKHVRITSYSVSGASEDVPTESLSLNFEELKVVYQQRQVGSGRPGFPPSAFVLRTNDPGARGPDLNGDGTADPLFFNYASLVDFNGDGLFTLIASARQNPAAPPDLNGDGKADEITPAGSRSIPVDLNGDGEEDTLTPNDYDGDSQVDPLFPLDANGDGIADFLAELHAPAATMPRGRMR